MANDFQSCWGARDVGSQADLGSSERGEGSHNINSARTPYKLTSQNTASLNPSERTVVNNFISDRITKAGKPIRSSEPNVIHNRV